MRPQPIERQRRALPTTSERPVPVALKAVTISLRTRIVVWLMRHFLRPLLRWVVHGSLDRIARVQMFLAARSCRHTAGLPLDYVVLGRVPGHFVGKLTDTHKTAILYLHGGAFLIPAVPETHVTMMALLCRDLDAVGFMADYRLAPWNRFPAALDDCERAYEALLELGFAPERIVIAGESAGGNLTLGVLQRIRRKKLPMPACAVPISPATELGRIHGPPSRALKYKSDPILPMDSLARVAEMYAGGMDASDPELSPLYADLRGFPPLYLLASDAEVLLDDTTLLARRAREQGVNVRYDIWPILPHAFPLFEAVMPEVKQARTDIVAFIKEHVRV
ncbi:MAG TPA: alpha/beta hydrolase [Nevskiaceae bacterium]|nr:alpha/beta hydrolase [Nevskiaceae bacterium]